jgi:transcriptional regulator with XRE-family HTH domain
MQTNAPTKQTWVINSAKDFGRTLAGVRRARRLTQKTLAEMTGMHRSYLAGLESDSETLELQRLMLALKRLGAEVTVTFRDETIA